MCNLPGNLKMLNSTNSTHFCDDHADKKAVVRIQGETDSFGCEYLFMCLECYHEYKAHVHEPEIRECDWCKKHDMKLRPCRDMDEGLNGPVYSVCKHCEWEEMDYRRSESGDYVSPEENITEEEKQEMQEMEDQHTRAYTLEELEEMQKKRLEQEALDWEEYCSHLKVVLNETEGIIIIDQCPV